MWIGWRVNEGWLGFKEEIEWVLEGEIEIGWWVEGEDEGEWDIKGFIVEWA